MLLQQNAILLFDSMQNTWCVSQFGTIGFIKTQKYLRRSVNFIRFIKNALLCIFFLYFYNGLIFGGLIYRTTFVLVFWSAYIREAHTRMGGGYYLEICSILDSVIIRFSEVFLYTETKNLENFTLSQYQNIQWFLYTAIQQYK